MPETNELSSVVRSMVEKVSSPTLLMREVMRLVRDVDGVAVFGVAATVERPLISVTSSAVIARTGKFSERYHCVFIECAVVLKYIECSSTQYFRDSILSRLENFETRHFRYTIY